MADETSSKSARFEPLVNHRVAIQRYIQGIVRDRATAEDLTQETLLRAQEKLPTLEDPAKLTSWLYRIATNLCRDHFRRPSNRERSRRSDSGSEDPIAHAPPPADPRLDRVMEQKEMSACVQEYLTSLSDPYRAVILLHDVEGLTNPEIAKMLGVSVASVKIRLHRAREKLRAALSDACSFSIDDRGVTVCERKSPSEEE